MAGINQRGTTAYGVAVEVAGGAQLGRGGEAGGFGVAILHEQVSAQASAIIHLIVVGIEQSA